MRNPRVPAAAVSAAAAVLFAAGCDGGSGHAAPAPATSSPAPATGTPASAVEVYDSVTKAPVFPDGEVVAQAANATGSREMEIKGGVGSGTLSVLVNCVGKGELTVTVEPLGFSFPFACVAGRVSTIGNAMNMNGGTARPHTPGTVRVTASAGVRWAITVGHENVSGQPES
ncbi:hypothetical protein [Streptomyces sp.]|uniref:hypothetical protein n=1 Tax=Streptomyces sp. TaxID=1931 RepID=UPI0025CCDDC2|nr:hypothetical protein [Streptomyces sp.]